MVYSNEEHIRVDIDASVRYTGEEDTVEVSENLKSIIEQVCEILGVGYTYHGYEDKECCESNLKDVSVKFSLYEVYDSELNILHRITNQKGIGLITKTN